MNTNQTQAAVAEMPGLPSNVPNVMRRIRACESEVPAQLVLEHAMREYGSACMAPKEAEVVRLRALLNKVLSTNRGTSGRIIIEIEDENKLRAALAINQPGA